MARPLAERGFQVLIQSTAAGSAPAAASIPMRQEREDGLATLDWVVKQPWFGDSIVLVGVSYLGFVQWAVADQLPPQVKAMIPQVTESALTLEFLRKDGMSLETPFGWGVTDRRPGTALRDPAEPVPGRREQPGRCARSRSTGPTSPPSASAPSTSRTSSPTTPTHALGRRSTIGTASPGERAGQLDRRLVRHLPARPAARLPGAAGSRRARPG